LKEGASLENLMKVLNGLVKSLFTGSLTINFYKGNVGKLKLSRTIKSSDVENF